MVNRSSSKYFSIDTSELDAMAGRLGVVADKIIKDEMRTAGRKSIEHFKTEANALINHKSGLMGRSWRWKLDAASNGFTWIIRNVAQSAAGFPYPVAIEFGRKAFSAINAKVLRFVIGGEVIFAKRVKAAPAQHVAERGITAARPRIEGEFDVARNRAAAKIEASV